MYSEVFAFVSAAGATGLCSSSFALTGCVAACYRHWQVSCSSGNCIEARHAAAALDLATARAASSRFHPVVAHSIGSCTVKFGSCVIMHFEFS